MTISVKKIEDTMEFYQTVLPILMKKEAENNLLLGLLNQIRDGTSRYQDAVKIIVKNEKEIRGIFLMTPPHHMIIELENDDDLIKEVTQQLKQIVMDESLSIPGFIGEKESVIKFADLWTSGEYTTNMRQRIYKLDKVNTISYADGHLEKATVEEKELVAAWIMGFIEDTPERPITKEQALEKAQFMLEEQSVYFWIQEGIPVSMARRARATENGITVNMVYTPREHRKKGLASSVVAGLSTLLLQEYSFCTLYTDLDNPTSNKIYMNIGYKPIADSIMINFKSF